VLKEFVVEKDNILMDLTNLKCINFQYFLYIYLLF